MKRDLYGEVSARIIAELEAGAAPWIKPRSATPCAPLGAETAGRTKQHRVSKWRAESISKYAQRPAREPSRFGKEFRALTLVWGARIRTWEWRNQNPLPYHLATPQIVECVIEPRPV